MTEDPRLARGAEFVRGEGIRTLIQFLQDNSYSHTISSKLAKGPPTTAEFNDMAAFIVKQLDPYIKDLKPQDLPDLFKALR